LPEQRRIVEQVEALLAQVTAARERLTKVPLILKRFRQAVLAAACSGKLTEAWREGSPEDARPLLERLGASAAIEGDLPPADIPASWRWIATEAVCDRGRPITYGVIKLGAPVAGGVPTLRSSDVRCLFIDPDNVKRISPAISTQYGRTVLAGGEVLVTVRGTLGGVAVVPPSMAG